MFSLWQGLCDCSFKNIPYLSKILAHQGCHGQGKKSGKLNFFQVREKSGNLDLRKGNWKKLTKVREFQQFSENRDGYGSLFNFQKHKFTKLASFFC